MPIAQLFRTVNNTLYLSQGMYEGRATWHYVLVDRLKLNRLLKDASKGVVDLTKYGRILFSGFGEVPPQEVTQFLRKKYNIKAA